MRSLATIITGNAAAQSEAFKQALATVAANKPNGFTVDVYGKEYTGGGFAVGVREVTPEAAAAGVYEYFVSEGQGLPKEKPFFGGWKDKDGAFYLDYVRVIQDKDEAITLGNQNNQIAIYDLNKGEEIRLHV